MSLEFTFQVGVCFFFSCILRNSCQLKVITSPIKVTGVYTLA